MGAQAVRLSNVDIDNALKNKDFEVLFQPIFDLGNGALARMESFVRWRHPKLGLLPPGAFISFFESQGRMSELTRYVMAHALKSYTAWRGPFAPGLSINLALSDLTDDAFVPHFQKLLRDFDFPADLVTLECPMPAVDMAPDAAAAHFQRLGGSGARLAIEVRGRANDLLRSLDPFPFDEIKTGGSAILRFARTVRGPGLSAIADLLDVASKANAAITAVGVEDQASLSALRGLGFTAAQGNHLGKVGELKEFRPHRINEVRTLLGLDPLSQENLTALFRTAAPSPSPSERAEARPAQNEEDALIGRLNERVAQFGADVAAAPAEAALSNEDRKAKAREKAKALMLAKRAKERAERKAAAIERVKARAAQQSVDGSLFEEATEVREAASPPASQPAAAREMQERLNREFKPAEDADQRPSAAEPAPEKSEVPSLPDLDKSAPPAKAKPEIAGDPFLVTREDIAAARSRKAGSVVHVPVEEPMRAAAAAGQAAFQPVSRAAILEPFTMSVGATGAYFQPGIRVGAAALPDTPHSPVPPAAPNIPRLPAVTAAAEPPKAPPAEPAQPAAPSAPAQPAAAEPQAPAAKQEAAKSTVERAVEAFAAPQPASRPAPAPAPDDAPATAEAPASGAEISDAAREAEAPAPVRARRRKPFLRRTIIPYPKYFWPKSWRRAWKRRAAAKAAMRNQTDTGTLAAE